MYHKTHHWDDSSISSTHRCGGCSVLVIVFNILSKNSNCSPKNRVDDSLTFPKSPKLLIVPNILYTIIMLFHIYRREPVLFLMLSSILSNWDLISIFPKLVLMIAWLSQKLQKNPWCPPKNSCFVTWFFPQIPKILVVSWNGVVGGCCGCDRYIY